MTRSLGGRRTLSGAFASSAVVSAVTLAACGGGGGADRSAAPTSPTESGEFSVLTYNVAAQAAETTGLNPVEHLPMISPLLNNYDIVATQELYDWWTPVLDGWDFEHYQTRLRAEVTHEYRSGRHPGPEAAGLDPEERPELVVGDGLGFLSRFPFVSRFPLEDEVRVAWNDCFGGDCQAMKGFAMVTITLGDDIPIDLYTMHAETGVEPEDQELQAADFDQLGTYIEQHSAGHAVIVAGDTNLFTADDENPEAARGADGEIWNGFLSRLGLTDACEAVSCSQPGIQDKIAFRGDDSLTLTATGHEFPADVFTAPNGEPLSDHLPVVTEFSWQVAA